LQGCSDERRHAMEATARRIFNLLAAEVGLIGTYLFGGWDTCIITIAIFMGLDYTTGFVVGFINKQLSSSVGFRGILKKSTILIVIIVATLLDRLLNDGVWVFRTLTCYFFIANEGISILENVGRMGGYVPTKLLDALEQLKDKGE
jgi:toxin secretion/phage lysis holin